MNSKFRKLKLESMQDNPLFVEIKREDLQRLKGGDSLSGTSTKEYLTAGEVTDWADEDA